MSRLAAGAIGLFLLALWIAGLLLHVAPWLRWFDGGAALLALGLAATPTSALRDTDRGGLTSVLTIGLYVLWIFGFAADAPGWHLWGTLAAAIASTVAIFSAAGSFDDRAHARP